MDVVGHSCDIFRCYGKKRKDHLTHDLSKEEAAEKLSTPFKPHFAIHLCTRMYLLVSRLVVWSGIFKLWFRVLPLATTEVITHSQYNVESIHN